MSEEMKNLNEQPEEAPVENVETQVEPQEEPQQDFSQFEARKPLNLDKKTLAIIGGAAAAVIVVVGIIIALILGGQKTPDNGPVLNDYTLGMGAVVSIDDTNAQVDGIVAAVVLDKNGVIVHCYVDAIQNKVTIKDDGTFTIGNTKTKRELGFNYNMAAFGTSLVGNEKVKEWFEQADAFEAWCVGKTIAQVEAMATQVKGEHNYVISADEALLAAGCTISIEDFVKAVVKAGNDDQKVSFQTAGTITLGLAINSADSGSTAYDTENSKDGAIQVYSDFAATALVDGKVVASLNDAIQPKTTFGADGKITGTSFKGTKRELKEGYNMAAFGTSLVGNEKVVEWYLQSAAFSAHIVGKTSDEIKNLPVQTKGEHNYIISNDSALLGAGCTMSIDGIQAVVMKAIDNAK